MTWVGGGNDGWVVGMTGRGVGMMAEDLRCGRERNARIGAGPECWQGRGFLEGDMVYPILRISILRR